jgi:hypothetical protein
MVLCEPYSTTQYLHFAKFLANFSTFEENLKLTAHAIIFHMQTGRRHWKNEYSNN